MSSGDSPKQVVPLPRIPKVMGILNITFGAALLLCGVCSGLYTASLPMMAKALTQFTKQAEDKQKASIKTQLDALAEQEKSAETEKAKIELAKKRQQLEDAMDRPSMAPAMNLEKMGMTEPRIIRFAWAVEGVMLILNVLMIVSGIGLVRFKPFGRKLGLWVAGAKVVSLIALGSYCIVAVIPLYSRKLAEFAVDMVQQQAVPGTGARGLPPVDFLVRTYTIIYSLACVAFVVFGAIYPIVCLFLLSRPGARAACLASQRQQERSDVW